MLDSFMASLEKIFTVGTLVTTGIAGVAAWFGGLWSSRKKAQQLDIKHQVEVKSIRALISAASGIAPNNLTLEAIRTILSESSNSLEELQEFIKAVPAPYVVWIKKREGERKYKMVQVNNYFAYKYLNQPAEFYTGKYDSDIWNNEYAEQFADNDEETYQNGTSLRIIEPIASHLTGAKGYFSGVKFVYRTKTNIYVCGLGRHIDEEDKDVIQSLQLTHGEGLEMEKLLPKGTGL